MLTVKKKCRSEKKPDKTETWSFRPKIASATFSETTRENFDCPFCKDTYESELHFLLVCPNYSALRTAYIPAKFYIRSLAFEMALLLADINFITALSNDVSKAFDLRNERSICPGP